MIISSSNGTIGSTSWAQLYLELQPAAIFLKGP